MTIRARVRNQSSINVHVGSQSTINTRFPIVNLQNSKLEDLLNVDEQSFGLDDGDTLVYDAETETWITVPENSDLDGGSY